MVTRAQAGVFKPNPRYANPASTSPPQGASPIPRSVQVAVRDPNWLGAMREEFAALVYCDNISAVYMSANPVHHRRTKHVELDIHFVRERVALGEFRVLHVPTRQQFADVMTKGLPTDIFQEFQSSLCVSTADVTTAEGC
jgi:hypothetical protein